MGGEKNDSIYAPYSIKPGLQGVTSKDRAISVRLKNSFTSITLHYLFAGKEGFTAKISKKKIIIINK